MCTVMLITLKFYFFVEENKSKLMPPPAFSSLKVHQIYVGSRGSREQHWESLRVGTNLIHDFTAVTFSVKLAVFREKRPFPWSPWFFVNFNAFTFIFEGFVSNRIVLPLKCEGHLTGINISVWDGIQTEPIQVTKKSCLNGVRKGAWIVSSERRITSIYYCY